MALQERIARNYISLGVARFVSKFIAFLSAVVIARHLGAASFGLFTFAFAAVTLAVVVFQAGLTQLVVREIARDRARAGHYLTVSLIVRFVGGALVALVTAGIWATTRSPAAAATAIAAVALGLAGLLASFTDLFQGFERMEYVAVVLVVNNVLTLALVAFGVWTGARLTVILFYYAVANLVSLLLAAVLAFAKFARPAGRVGVADVLSFCRSAVYFSLSALVASVFWRADSLILKALGGDRAVGIYGASSRIVEGLVVVSGSFRESVYPSLAKYWPASPDPFREISRTSFKFLIALAIPIGVGTSLVAYKLFPFIYGADYAEGWAVLALLIWALAFIFIRELSAATLFALDQQRIVVISNAIGAGLSVVLNLLLIPRLSYLGPAVAGVATAIATTAFNLGVISRKIKGLYPWRLTLKPALAAAVMGAVLWLGTPLPVLANVALGAVTYVAVLLALRYYHLDQIPRLLKPAAPTE